MSKATNPNGDSETSDYRIELTDIMGIGPKTVEKLEKVGITSVDELHLCRNGRASTTQNRLRKRDLTIGKGTWKHIKAVGEAVHYSRSGYVEAKHLNCALVDEKDYYQSVDITRQESSDSQEETQEVTVPSYSTEELQTAVDRIHGEYGEGYGEQVSFEGDLARFLHESDAFDSDDKLPTGIVQSVMRYRHTADTVESQGDFEDTHKAVLVAFSKTLN